GNANVLGAMIAMAAPMCVSSMLRRGWFAVAAWICAPLLVWGLVVSSSRRGSLAAVAAAVAGAAVVAGVVAILTVPALRDLNGDPGATRFHLYADAVHMVAARPLTGWGEEATGLVFGQFLSGDWSPGVTFDRTHSGPLELGATQGLLGLVAGTWLLVVIGRRLWARRFDTSDARLFRAPIASVPAGAVGAALVAYTVWVVFNFDWAPVTGVFWLLAGTGWSMTGAE